MHTSLTRAQFNERPLTPDDLQWIAAMLSDWHFQVRGHIPSLTLNVELWGYPKQDEAAVQSYLQARLAAAQVPALGTSLLPPPGELAPMVGGLLWALGDPAFEGLVAEVRLTLGVANPRTIVFYGLIQGGAFILKTTWSVGAGNFDDAAYTVIPWQYDARLQGALFDYRNGNQSAPAWVRAALFPERADGAVRSWIAWFLKVPDKQVIKGFLVRAGLSGMVFALSMVGMTLRTIPGIVLLCQIVGTASFFGLAFHILVKAKQIIRTREKMFENFRRLYTEDVRYLEVDPQEAAHWVSDPAIRKFSADIIALGGVHYKDITPPIVAGKSIARLFVFPEDATVLCLNAIFETGSIRMFPAKVTFVCRTNLSDGRTLVAASSGSGRRKPVTSAVIGRIYLGADDPETMLNRHRSAIQECERDGITRVPVEADAILAQIDRERRDVAEEMKQYCYFRWGDAVRMAFNLPRKEYRDYRKPRGHVR